jgi:hypothetical protein
VAVEHGGGGDFFAAEVFRDGLEGEVLGFLCVEEDAAVGGESGGDGLLWLYRLALLEGLVYYGYMYPTSSVAIGWPLEVPCTDIFAAVVAKVFLCWFKNDAVGRIADREEIRGAVREAIRREETRDEAIVTMSRYLYV